MFDGRLLKFKIESFQDFAHHTVAQADAVKSNSDQVLPSICCLFVNHKLFS